MSRLGWDCRYTFGAVLATEMKMAARVTHESSLFGAGLFNCRNQAI